MSIQSLDQANKVKGLGGNRYILLEDGNAFVFYTNPSAGLSSGVVGYCTAMYLLQMAVLKFFVVVVGLVQ